LRAWLAKFKEADVDLVALEATGGYGRGLVCAGSALEAGRVVSLGSLFFARPRIHPNILVSSSY
jgi:hypothetical protein